MFTSLEFMSFCPFLSEALGGKWCSFLCEILQFFKILPEEKCEAMFCGVDQPQFCQDAKDASCNDETLISDLPFFHSTDFEKDSNVSN